MDNSKVDRFFYSGNAVKGEPDYALADMFAHMADAFANVTYQGVYIIDYYKKNFLYVSSNPLFLCDMKAEDVKRLGYQFYLDHVPADEIDMLLEINQAGFSFIKKIPFSEKKKYTISYDFHLIEGHTKILINHKLTGLAFLSDGSLWLALCVVSLSSHSNPGHITIHCRDNGVFWEYDLRSHIWEKYPAPVLNDTEKAILVMSIQGMTIQAIAEHAHLAVDSIKTARRRLYEKLGVSNITEAISFATNYKLI